MTFESDKDMILRLYENTFLACKSISKSWVVECLNDNIKTWKTVDEEKDCPYLNGKSLSHTFTMNNQKSTEFRFLLVQTGIILINLILTHLNYMDSLYLSILIYMQEKYFHLNEVSYLYQTQMSYHLLNFYEKWLIIISLTSLNL